jgi:hypothetical protein
MTDEQKQEICEKWLLQCDDPNIIRRIRATAFLAGLEIGLNTRITEEKLRKIARNIDTSISEAHAYSVEQVDNAEDVWFDYLKKELT